MADLKIPPVEQSMLIIGQSGFLGSHIARQAKHNFNTVGTVFSGELREREYRFDFFADRIEEVLRKHSIQLVVFAAQVASAGNAFKPIDKILLRDRMQRFVEDCRNCRLIFTSSDAVFKGDRGCYLETDVPEPRTPYGENMLTCEQIIQSSHPDARIVRVSYLYGKNGNRWDRRLAEMRDALMADHTVQRFCDVYRSPVRYQEAAAAVLDVCLRSNPGLYHVSAERLSIYEFHRQACDAMGLNSTLLEKSYLPTNMMHYLARDTSLSSNRILQIGPSSTVFESITLDLRSQDNGNKAI